MNAPDLAKIARTNPRVDLETVRQYEAYAEEVSRAGAELTPGYRIAPPIGGQQAGREQEPGHSTQALSSWVTL